MSLARGSRLGPYEILAPLGSGAMGEIYRARDTRLGRDVAIKVLPEHLEASREVRARFEREAKAASGLNDPHVCALFDIGHDGGTDYLVMELVEGEPLSRRIARGPLPGKEVVKLGAQIAHALDHAHRAGIVHRDLKPGNIMLTKGGVKLMDFGLARAMGAAADPVRVRPAGAALPEPGRSEEPLTSQGTILGTVPYMAPEQIEGKEADARSDLWALGCVLYEMATGAQPFQGTNAATIISAILRDQPRVLCDLAPKTPAALTRVVLQCLAKDPEERWQSAGDLARELAWIGEAGAHAGAPASGRARLLGRRGAAWGPVAVGAALAIAASSATWYALHRGEPRFTFAQLTYRPMGIYTAAFAPDGRSVLFTAVTDGYVRRIFLRRPEDPELQPIGEAGLLLLSVSANGELAVLTDFSPLRMGTLARMPMAGGDPRDILENVRAADWTPDGSQLAVIHHAAGTDRIEFPIGRVLFESASELTDLRVSPGGDLFAFFEHPLSGDTRGSVNVVDLKGRRRILSDGWDTLDGLAWSPDGKEILFSAEKASPQLRIYAVTPKGRIRLALEMPGGTALHDVSRMGRWLTTRDDLRLSVMVHRPGWSCDRDLSWLSQSGDGSLSHDGSKLVFTDYTGASGSSYTVCLRKTDGSHIVRLGEGIAFAMSRDERWVLAGIPTTPPQLVAYPTGAGGARRLAGEGMSSFVTGWWSPSGDSVAYIGSERGKGRRFYVQGLAGGLPRPVTPEEVSIGRPSLDFSSVLASGPDGRYLIYPLGGGTPRQARGLSRDEYVVRWDARTNTALSVKYSRTKTHIERIDVVTGQRSPFHEIEPANHEGAMTVGFIRVADDSRSYSYTVIRMLSTLFLAEPRG